MPNVNKVVYGNNTIIDLTSDTVTPSDVLNSKSFHDASGTLRTGSADISGKADKVSNATNGDLAGLDSSGNLTDSGISATNVVTKKTSGGILDSEGYKIGVSSPLYLEGGMFPAIGMLYGTIAEGSTAPPSAGDVYTELEKKVNKSDIGVNALLPADARLSLFSYRGTDYSIPSADVSTHLADWFLSTESYAVGDYCFKPASVGENIICYRCTVAHTGAWDDNHFTPVKVFDEIKNSGGGSGHTMTPTPSASLTRSDLQTAIASAVTEGGINDDVVSAWAVGNWSNTMTQRVIYSGTIAEGDTGIGTWVTESELADLKAEADLTVREATEINTYGWWKDVHFLGLDSFDDYEIRVKYKLKDTNEVITLGGFILDTDTGCLCIKFGSSIKNAGNVVAVDITITQNNISSSGGS